MAKQLIYTIKEGKARGARYCATQDRTQQQVRDKLYDWGLYGDEVEEVIAWLISEDFINEERFAQSYVRGHFRLKKWGRIKIKQGLEQKKISEYCIKVGMKEIDVEEYQDTIFKLLEKKWKTIKDSNQYIKKQKVVRYLLQKGFESDLVWSEIDNLKA
ncbi:regulatory protein RecX [uncultured Marivirga sp.]|uniref:regulatory protein RecX n=1 Tax=uncultured Marivirga sp. TaxID=1123707 RepID=UPI0030EC5CDB|tara:strand:- start:135483 stop:135956 length:474 start_codon:yes stop_codon:yes gene_type:complete